MFHHVVLFKLKDNSEKNIQEARTILLSMEGNISVLKDLEVGVNVLHSERSYDLFLKTSFLNEEDYHTYQKDPYHVDRVLYFLKPLLEDSKTCDYLT